MRPNPSDEGRCSRACVCSAPQCQSRCILRDARRAAPRRSGKGTCRGRRTLAWSHRNFSRPDWGCEMSDVHPKSAATSARTDRRDMVCDARSCEIEIIVIPSEVEGVTANLSAMKLLLATRNQHKTREFTQLLGPNFTLRDLTRTRDLPEIRETGRA